jgi:hypothetical protein
VGSVRAELVAKSREAALSAIRIYNDPQTCFKSESFIVLMVIAWTYLLHAYYRSKGIDYRYYSQGPVRKRYDRTKHGAYKYWGLERCLNDTCCPVDRHTANNLRFLIGLRHEIEHQMTKSLDSWLSGRYQACAMNYNSYLKKLFGERWGLDDLLTFSIQFLELNEEQIRGPQPEAAIPQRIRAYIAEFDSLLTPDEFNSERFSYRMIFSRKLVNHPGQADSVIEFIDPSSEIAKEIDKQYWVRKEVERKKYRAKDVVQVAHDAGFKRLSIYGNHLRMWQREDAKNPAKGYGVEVQGTWYWYQTWVDRVLELCEVEGDRYR